jgi:hypothetical protein
MIKEVVPACVEEDIHHRYVMHLRNEKLQKNTSVSFFIFAL